MSTEITKSGFKPLNHAPRRDRDLWVFVDVITPEIKIGETGAFIHFDPEKIISKTFKVSSIDEIAGDENQSYLTRLNGDRYHFNLSVEELTNKIVRTSPKIAEVHLEQNMLFGPLIGKKNITPTQIYPYLKYCRGHKGAVKTTFTEWYQNKFHVFSVHINDLKWGERQEDVEKAPYFIRCEKNLDGHARAEVAFDINELRVLINTCQKLSIKSLDYRAYSQASLKYWQEHGKLKEAAPSQALNLLQDNINTNSVKISSQDTSNGLQKKASSTRQIQLERLYKQKCRKETIDAINKARFKRGLS